MLFLASPGSWFPLPKLCLQQPKSHKGQRSLVIQMLMYKLLFSKWVIDRCVCVWMQVRVGVWRAREMKRTCVWDNHCICVWCFCVIFQREIRRANVCECDKNVERILCAHFYLAKQLVVVLGHQQQTATLRLSLLLQLKKNTNRTVSAEM